jgi:hypothetical protein
MARIVQRQAFVGLPLLRAIAELPETTEADGVTLRLTGEVSSAPIMVGFAGHRAFVEADGCRGSVDLSSASSKRCEMTLRLEGLRPSVVEHLLLALRDAMMASTAVDSAAPADERMHACRTA